MSLSTSSSTVGCDLRHSRDSSSIFFPQNFERSRERSSSSPSLDHEAKAPWFLITEARVGETSAIKTSAISEVGWLLYKQPLLFLEGPAPFGMWHQG